MFFYLCKLNRCVSSTKGKNRHIRMEKIEKKGSDRKRRETQTKVDGV